MASTSSSISGSIGPSSMPCVDSLENQRKIIDQVITELTQQSIFDAPLVTEVNAEMPFYTADKEHNNYFNNNREQTYCQAVIEPKINKFIETYKAHLK